MLPILDTKHTALLVIDMEYDYCSPAGALAKKRQFTFQNMTGMIGRLSPFISFIRNTGTMIIFARMIEDPVYMSENARDKIMSSAKMTPLCNPDTKGFGYFGVLPQPGDKEIIKNSYEAFLTKDNHNILKSKGIETELLQDILETSQINCIIFTGMLTSRCVDSTLRIAFHRGYNCIALADLVAVPDQLQFEHEATLNVWDTLFANVVKSDEIKLAQKCH